MQPPMKGVPPLRNNKVFTPDFSEGAEIGVYLALLELIDEGLLITGDETIIDANSAACRLLERSYRQLAGQPLSELFVDGHAFLEARQRLLIQEQARGTLRLALSDGRVQDFSYIAVPRLRPGIHAIVLGHERPAGATVWPQTLHFQPQVNARNGTIYAGEACWQPRRGRLPANYFSRAVTTACRTAATWPHVRGHTPTVSIGVSMGQLCDGNLPRLIQSALATSQLDPRSLELSIDACALCQPEAEIAPTLRALVDMRVRLALDNFGRTPVPFAQLNHDHFSVLKLDATLTTQIGRNDDDTALIEAIINMSAPLGIQVMARGVQNKAQQDFLLALGCELQQGPFIGAALEEHIFAGFLSEHFFVSI